MHVMVMVVIIMMVMAIVIPLLASSAPSSLGVRQCPSIDSRILNS